MRPVPLAVSIAALGLSLLGPAGWAEGADPEPGASASVAPAPPARRAGPAEAPAVVGATPRRALLAFVRAAEAGDFDGAAALLDLRSVPPARRAREGAELAAMLHRVLVWSVALTPERLPDEVELEEQTVVVETLELSGAPAPIVLERQKRPTGAPAWRFSSATVARIRPLYEAQDRRSLEERMPEALTRRTFLTLAPWQWLGLPALVLACWALARVLGAVLLALIGKPLARFEPAWVGAAARAAGPAARLAAAVAAFVAAAPYLMLPPFAQIVVDRATLMLGAVAGAWASIAIVRAGTRAVAAGLPGDTAGELENRGLKTRLLMIERVAAVTIALVAVSVVLLQFEVVRTVGLSLLASAGIAGIVLGIAAQRSLGGVISGIELAFTQPLRIGDTVVVEGEWGIVEQMYFTYVVIRCWDERRLLVPVARLLSQPFQNWTRGQPEMLASVELFADYGLPVPRLRAEAERLVRAHALWDGRVFKLQVTDATDRTIQIRVVASVDNCSKAFDLRCELREGLVQFLQELDGGAHLPRQRVEGPPGAAS